jgi:hypothetical protein
MTTCFQQAALRAIRFADVRFGILPSQSGFRRNDEVECLTNNKSPIS